MVLELLAGQKVRIKADGECGVSRHAPNEAVKGETGIYRYRIPAPNSKEVSSTNLELTPTGEAKEWIYIVQVKGEQYQVHQSWIEVPDGQ